MDKNDIQIIADNLEWKLIIHWAFETEHAAKYSAKLILTGHILDGQVVYKECITPKSKKTGNFGKSKMGFYIQGGDMYNSIIDLLNVYTDTDDDN